MTSSSFLRGPGTSRDARTECPHVCHPILDLLIWLLLWLTVMTPFCELVQSCVGQMMTIMIENHSILCGGIPRAHIVVLVCFVCLVGLFRVLCDSKSIGLMNPCGTSVHSHQHGVCTDVPCGLIRLINFESCNAQNDTHSHVRTAPRC